MSLYIDIHVNVYIYNVNTSLRCCCAGRQPTSTRAPAGTLETARAIYDQIITSLAMKFATQHAID